MSQGQIIQIPGAKNSDLVRMAGNKIIATDVTNLRHGLGVDVRKANTYGMVGGRRNVRQASSANVALAGPEITNPLLNIVN